MNDHDEMQYKILHENEQVLPYNNYYDRIPSECNVKDFIHLPLKTDAVVILISRAKTSLPIKDLKIKTSPGSSSYRFILSRHKSPYVQTYLPELVDLYPQESTTSHGVAPFCFPEGISIKLHYDMPKWFNFVLTDEYGKRTYGSTLVFTEDISSTLRDSLVPSYRKEEKYYVEKAICVISEYPFFTNCRIFLRELYRIQVSSKTNIPLERAICHFVDSLYFPRMDSVLSFTIAEEELKFYRVPIYGSEWDTNSDCIEILFSLLSYQTILTLWEGLLLEKNVFLVCSSKATLVNIAMALVTLLFPFRWMHVFIPVLPEKLKVFVESPVPSLIGICFPLDFNELPHDSLILLVEEDTFKNAYDKLPKLPKKLNEKLMKKLNKLKTKCNLDNPKNGLGEGLTGKEAFTYLDEVFPSVEREPKAKFDAGEIRNIFYEFFLSMFKNYEKYFTWKKASKDKKGVQVVSDGGESVMFLKDVFLKDHASTEPGSFLSYFSETSIFAQFEDTFKTLEPNSSTSFFIDSIKKDKDRVKYYLPVKVPGIATVIPEINVDDLRGRSFSYTSFPMLDNKLYIKTEMPRAPYHSRFVYTRDEWCYDPLKLTNKEWGRFIMYTIYEIWVTFFSYVVHFYEDKKAQSLMEHALFLVEDLTLRKKILPSKNFYTKLIKACGKNSLDKYVKQLLDLINSTTNRKSINAVFHNAFLNGLYAMTDNINSIPGMLLSNSSLGGSQSVQKEMLDPSVNEDVSDKFNKIIFMTYEFCPYCLKNKKDPKKIIIEEIFSGFSRGKSDYASLCPSCLNKIFPKLYFLHEEQKTLTTEHANFMSPIVLVKEVDNIIKNQGEKYFYKETFHNDKYYRHIFWNLVFYFQVFDLPTCVLYVENDAKKFEEIKISFMESRSRREIPKRNSSNRLTRKGDDISQQHLSVNDAVSKKYSSNSNDVASVSGRSGLDNLSKVEKDLWDGIRERMERTVSKNRAFEKNPNEDRGEVSTRTYTIKHILSKNIEYFVTSMKGRLAKFLSKIELERKDVNGGNVSSNPNTNTNEFNSVVLSNENVSNNNDGGRRRGMARQAEQIVSEFQLNDVHGDDHQCGEMKLKEIENWNNKFAIHNNNMNKVYDDNANVFPSFLTGNTAAINSDTTNVHKRMTLLSTTTQKSKPQSSKVIVGDKK